MGKRKNSSSEERIRRKIQKLEEKLKRKSRQRTDSLSSNEDSNDNIIGDDEHGMLPSEDQPRWSIPELPRSLSALLEAPSVPDEPPGLQPIPGPSSAPDLVVVEEQAQDCELEEEILKILGEAPQADIALGANIHKDISARWQEILKNGLSKEVRDKLVTQYLIPANCQYLLAPLLNPEAKAAISETLSKRDGTMQQKQGQIGVVLAALSQVIESIISGNLSKQKLLQPLSDACRILCDSHYLETKTRRSIIMSSINVSLRDTLADTSRDKYLFGEDVLEKLKVAKSVQKTGESLQKVIPKQPTRNVSQMRKNNL